MRLSVRLHVPLPVCGHICDLSRGLHLAKPPFPHLSNKDNNTCHTGQSGAFSDTILTRSLWLSRHPLVEFVQHNPRLSQLKGSASKAEIGAMPVTRPRVLNHSSWHEAVALNDLHRMSPKARRKDGHLLASHPTVFTEAVDEQWISF